MSKIKWYASINRAKNSGIGTKIRLSGTKHFKVLKFLEWKYQHVITLKQTNPNELPVINVVKKDWDTLSGELKAGHGINFTRIFMNSKEFCIICEEGYKQEIQSTILLSEAAKKKREEDELKKQE